MQFPVWSLLLSSKNKSESQVKGVTSTQDPSLITPTTAPKKSSAEPVRVDNTFGNYYVYTNPDINSPVIYVAKEGESLNILDQNDAWYQVQVSDAHFGWLPKSSVKATK